ncbi:MAG: MnmC family methyltransferase [Clostridia bacterium]|nr:MnmC family methyltransferase [Clostridia bacterium]
MASVVKSALIAAGFAINKYPGCGGKKHVLQGIKC